MDTATFIKVSRKALGLTQDQLSPLINKKRYNISFYESGKTTPPGDVVLKIIQLRFPELCLSDTHSKSEDNPKTGKKQTESPKMLVA
ncbi:MULTISPECIES: helix-turn-helix domain-containing protein [Desulfobacula]|uniref:Predicted DNA-binding protein n=2 Tax=Desulfobacula TaxID=28222 RepID=K0NQN0_DESTT|nr:MULTISPECIES: helix-turn-helix transcriptional regulator [Desulfobacula]CCK81232.1 predicted DNA-binding protein [Desulfobacula toluolica Tol2]SDU38859.1 Helix-turn-helix [Desulfobacula phenolica]